MTSELEQVAREHGAPGVCVERFAATPCAAVESEGALEGRDVGFDAGAKVPKGTVGGSFRAISVIGETDVLAEDDVAYTERANVGEVPSSSKAAIKDDVAWARPTTLAVLSTAETARVESPGLPASVCRSSTRPDDPVARQTL